MKIALHVNGKASTVEVDDPKMPLLYALRNDLGCMARASAAAWDNAGPARFLSTATRCVPVYYLSANWARLR